MDNGLVNLMLTMLIVGTCCVISHNCNVDGGCNLGCCLKVLTKFVVLYTELRCVLGREPNIQM